MRCSCKTANMSLCGNLLNWIWGGTSTLLQSWRIVGLCVNAGKKVVTAYCKASLWAIWWIRVTFEFVFSLVLAATVTTSVYRACSGRLLSEPSCVHDGISCDVHIFVHGTALANASCTKMYTSSKLYTHQLQKLAHHHHSVFLVGTSSSQRFLGWFILTQSLFLLHIDKSASFWNCILADLFMSQQLLSVIAPFMHELGSKAAQSLNAVSHKPSLACREWQTLVRDH